jgi:hypothetical protein
MNNETAVLTLLTFFAVKLLLPFVVILLFYHFHNRKNGNHSANSTH